jgi:hypothetical protein
VRDTSENDDNDCEIDGAAAADDDDVADEEEDDDDGD